MTLLYVDIIYTVSIIKVNDNPSKITICQTSKTYLISSKGASHWQRILKNRTRVDPKTNCALNRLYRKNSITNLKDPFKPLIFRYKNE